jgi:pilus assembly protein CpaB
MAMKVGELRVMLRPPGSDQPFDLKLLSKADLLRLGRVRGNGIQFIIGGNG